MAHTPIGHKNQRTIRGSQDQAHVLLRRSVRANQQQVRTCLWQDFSLKPVADKLPAGNGEHAAVPCGSISQLEGGRELHRDREQMTRFEFCHWLAPCWNSCRRGSLWRLPKKPKSRKCNACQKQFAIPTRQVL